MPISKALQQSLDHQDPDQLCVDFGSTAVTGIHALVVQKLRQHFGLEEKPVIVHEPYQMLGLVEDERIRCLRPVPDSEPFLKIY